MVALARRRAAVSPHHTIDVEAGDMTAIVPPAVLFDAVVCALGVFFVDDMAELVRSLLALVRPGTGRLVVSVFGEDFYEPLRTVFVDAVASLAPDVDVVEPWRRTEHETTVRVLFEGTDVNELRILTDEDRVPLPDPSDCWRLVMGSALRHTVKRLGDDAAAKVRARCEAQMAAHRVTHLTTTTRYAVARRTQL
jgi:SAM-dependent methyltransferase